MLGALGAMVTVGKVAGPIYQFIFEPPQARYLASVYESNFSRLFLQSEGDVQARLDGLKLSLELKNISNEMLTSLVVTFDTRPLFGTPIDKLYPYAQTDVTRSVFAGPARSFLQPGETWRIELTHLLDRNVAKMLFSLSSYQKADIPTLSNSWRTRVSPFSDREALDYSTGFLSVRGAEQSVLFGTLIWVDVAYDAGKSHVQHMFFGGCAVPFGLDSQLQLSGGIGVAHDFVIQLPYTQIKRWHTSKVFGDMLPTELKLDLPKDAAAGGGSLIMGGFVDKSMTPARDAFMAPYVVTMKALKEGGGISYPVTNHGAPATMKIGAQ